MISELFFFKDKRGWHVRDRNGNTTDAPTKEIAKNIHNAKYNINQEIIKPDIDMRLYNLNINDDKQ